MAFRVEYTPVGSLVAAATAAGRSRAAQVAAAQDAGLARQRMATQAQLTQAAMATDIREQELDLKERAMELQEAAAARMARTPTARRSGVSPVAMSIQARLGELDKLKASGGLPDDQYMSAKLGIITGQRPQQPRVVRPRVPSYTERRTEARERADAIVEAERLERQLNQPGNLARKQRIAQQLTTLVGRSTERWGEDWRTRPGAAWQARHTRRREGIQARALPYDRGQLRRGQVYQLPDGRLGSWTGTRFKIIGD